jgi:fumarate reductase subunit D
MKRSREPALWALFSGGGMMAALFLPALAFVLWVAGPLGWVTAPSFETLAALALHPLTRFFLFGLAGLCFFHWAHRFRYTLYDGLQLYHLDRLIAVLTYGVATLLTLAAGVLLTIGL